MLISMFIPRSGSARIPPLTLFMLVVCIYASCNVCGQTAPAGTDFLKELQTAFPFQEMAVVSQDDLPVARPPPNTPTGWSFCDYSCMTNYATAVKVGSTPSEGVLTVDVQYKPIRNITSDMVRWLFENVHKSVKYTHENGSTTVYPMYLFFQGVDHLVHTASPAPVREGTVLTWCEMPLTGCKHRPLSATEPWSCPANRTGFLRSDPHTKWQNLVFTKAAMTVSVFNSSVMEFYATMSHPLFGGDSKRVVATTRHTWKDTDQGLNYRTQQWLGLMAPGQRTKFDTSILAGPMNGLISKTYLSQTPINNAKNIPAGNITAAGYMAALHYMQEYGNLPQWLPHVYNSRTQMLLG